MTDRLAKPVRIVCLACLWFVESANQAELLDGYESHIDGVDCRRCNYDAHRCQGCGEPLNHGCTACKECHEL